MASAASLRNPLIPIIVSLVAALSGCLDPTTTPGDDWPFGLALQSADAHGGFYAVFEVAAETGFRIEETLDATWNESQTYWAYTDLLLDARDRFVVQGFGYTEADSECTNSRRESCLARAWETTSSGAKENGVPAGRYVFLAEAFGATRASHGAKILTREPAAITDQGDFRTRLVVLDARLPAASHDDHAAYHVADHNGEFILDGPALVKLRTQGGGELTHVELRGEVGMAFRYEADPGAPGSGRWTDAAGCARSPAIGVGLPAGRYNLTATVRGAGHSFVLVGVSEGLPFVDASGRLTGFGPDSAPPWAHLVDDGGSCGAPVAPVS